MKRNRRDWLTGVAVAVVAAALYLLLAPPGRALYFSAIGIAPGTPRTEVEGAIGGPGGSSPDGFGYSIGIAPNTTLEQIERMHESMRQERMRYSGPLYAVDVQYAGFRHQRFVSIHLKWELTRIGVLTLLGFVLLAATAATASRRFRTHKATRGVLA